MNFCLGLVLPRKSCSGHQFLPTLAGNVFGGTLMFAVLSYAQVREEIEEPQ
jgi:formate/nitrite transporter FocA (FNT family)